MPDKIRLSTTAKNVWFEPGAYVRGLARLQPIAGPVFPDSYDFSFFAWFSGLGGSGFFMGQPEIIAETPDYNWHAGVSIFINRLRATINKRVVEAIPGDGGDVTVALITGDKSRIPKSIQTSLRNTGLAHILAISGLHMALVTLTLIWLIRLAFSFLPAIVLHYPVKKWAVCVGFIAATVYLLISGFGVATQRAWIMISVMLLAVLLDRRAITMRSVAVSAILILLINPQNLFSPGFQMSFAAVASLVAGYEFLRNRKINRAENKFQDVNEGWKDKFANGPYRYISGLVTTSLIAGTATSFVAAWHFHQIAPYGLLANVLAMPIVGTIIMPSALFSMLLMPYGMEKLALVPVEFGIGLVVQVSMWVESISPAGRTGILPENSLLLFGLFLAALTLFKTRLRLLGLAVLPMMYFFWEIPEAPQILVSENGRAIAVSNEEGQFGLLYPRRNRFVTDIWAKAWSYGGQMEKLNLSKDQCNTERCIVVLPSSLVMHVVYDPKLIRSSCQRADILIAPRLWWVNCRHRQPRLVLKRYDFEKRGSKAIYITQNKATPNNQYEITVRNGLTDSKRPWARKVRPIDEISDTAG